MMIKTELYFEDGMKATLLSRIKDAGVKLHPESREDIINQRVVVDARDGEHAHSFGSWDCVLVASFEDPDAYGRDK